MQICTYTHAHIKFKHTYTHTHTHTQHENPIPKDMALSWSGDFPFLSYILPFQRTAHCSDKRPHITTTTSHKSNVNKGLGVLAHHNYLRRFVWGNLAQLI